MKYPFVVALISSMVAAPLSAMAKDETPSFELTIAKHKFEPSTITIPANTKVKLIVKNTDATAEEFESEQLKREKVIPGGTQAVVYVGPLEPGTYPFVGEFNPATAKGEIVVK
jgi:plastocyanin